MAPLLLLGLASQHAHWLAGRQSVVAQNIANVATPGYRAKDVASFSDVLARTQLGVATTDPMHIGDSTAAARPAAVKRLSDRGANISGNSVNLEDELTKAGGINRAYALDIGITKSLQRMLLTGLKA